jgi:hypothetical protein
MTPLHLAAGAEVNDPVAGLKILLDHGANPLALTTTRSTALHMTRSRAFASHLIERDYWLARKGHPFDPTAGSYPKSG